MHPDQKNTLALIDHLCSPDPAGFRLALVVAHPDDEVLGAGSRLSYLGDNASIVCITDGSPRDPSYALSAGFENREAYAKARRVEFEKAMSICGIGPGQCYWTGIVDQEAVNHLAAISRELLTILDALNPDLVLTHPYEGGHPDHDSASFAVSAASALIGNSPALSVAEFTSYNAGMNGEGWETDFLPGSALPVRTVELSTREWELKRRLMGCYVSQKWIMDAFNCPQERFRPAPKYDFTVAPHHGTLFYERMSWGITGPQWRMRARAAAGELGIW